VCRAYRDFLSLATPITAGRGAKARALGAGLLTSSSRRPKVSPSMTSGTALAGHRTAAPRGEPCGPAECGVRRPAHSAAQLAPRRYRWPQPRKLNRSHHPTKIPGCNQDVHPTSLIHTVFPLQTRRNTHVLHSIHNLYINYSGQSDDIKPDTAYGISGWAVKGE